MEFKAAYLKITRTARYFLLGNNELPVDTILFVLHGYGMNAGEFIRQFEMLLKPGLLIVAPEGLSRFYRRGFSGEVVASWMTKEERLHEIDDYVNYLDKLFQFVVGEKQVKVVVLGFSQGAATAGRWLVKGSAEFDELIIWCGEFAAELEGKSIKQPVVRHIHARRDEFISSEQFNNQSARLRLLFNQVHDYDFDGTHTLDMATMKQVATDAGI